MFSKLVMNVTGCNRSFESHENHGLCAGRLCAIATQTVADGIMPVNKGFPEEVNQLRSTASETLAMPYMVHNRQYHCRSRSDLHASRQFVYLSYWHHCLPLHSCTNPRNSMIIQTKMSFKRFNDISNKLENTHICVSELLRRKKHPKESYTKDFSPKRTFQNDQNA
eukprot:5257400-Amphidinium_carterae.1